MNTTADITVIVILYFSFILVLAGVALIIKDQTRKRRGEPRPHEVWEAERKERIEKEKELIKKHGQQEQARPQRPRPPSKEGR